MTDTPQEFITATEFRPSDPTPQGGFQLSGVKIALGVAFLIIAWILWFLFTAKSVRLDFVPDAESVSVSGGFSFELQGVWLLREGNYEISAVADGYHPLESPIIIGDDKNQTHTLKFRKLPGRLNFITTPSGADVLIDETNTGQTPLLGTKIPAGKHQVTFSAARYQARTIEIEVLGLDQLQEIEQVLDPDWANIYLASKPEGATIFVDNFDSGVVTPGIVEILSGSHQVAIKLTGHKRWQTELEVVAEQNQELPGVVLEPADALVYLTSRPSNAGITLNGTFMGTSPLELALKPFTASRIRIFKAGFAATTKTISMVSGEERSLNVQLPVLTGQVVFEVSPKEAVLYVDGKKQTSANQTLTLSTAAHSIELKLAGYAGFTRKIVPKPNLTQELKVRLLTVAEARFAALKPKYTTKGKQEMALLHPQDFSMGASRREPGRRHNETLRDVGMERLFYLSTKEVTNRQFREFASGHDSGEFQEFSLNDANLPVVGVSWEEAARYCNWLSISEDRTPYYQTEFSKVIGVNVNSGGYRLPTEAEWAWSARSTGEDSSQRFPWGVALPPPDRFGNYADRAAAHLVGRIIFNYNDNHITAAPVGTFRPDSHGIYDLSGNVAEWVHDFYEIPSKELTQDPTGPKEGEFHVIRGSSWKHGTITDLRLSFRGYGVDGEQDLGFRIARYAE